MKYKNSGMNENTYELLFKDNTNYINAPFNDLICFQTIKPSLLKLLITKSLLIKYKILNKKFKLKVKDNKYIIFNDKKEIEFQTLLDLFKKNNITFDNQNDLQTRKRVGTCHENSMILTAKIKGSTLVTRTINNNELHVIHSVVINNNKGTSYVHDWTKNLVMKYEDYKEIYGLKEITKITHEEISEDIENCLQDFPFNTKEYCIFRHELMNDVKRLQKQLKK